jgi:mRNA-degrading endonuclease toxin of MazEF toxin-antitoxin module
MRKDPRAAPTQGYNPSASLVCPHCQTQGRVTARQIKMKKGVSGGKLTGAALTLGISMLGTGLSRKEKVTEMTCGKCRTVWHV